MSQNTIQEKIILPLVSLLKQDAEPSRLSLKLASGSVTGNCNGCLHGYCGFISFESSCYSACQLSCLSDTVHSFFPFHYIGKVLTGNSLDEISKTKFLETFDLGFLPEIQGLTKYFILASLGWTLVLAPLFAILYFVFKKLINFRLQL